MEIFWILIIVVIFWIYTAVKLIKLYTINVFIAEKASIDCSDSDRSHKKDTNMGILRISVNPHIKAIVMETYGYTFIRVTFPIVCSQFPINQYLCANYDSYLVFLGDSDIRLLNNRFQGHWQVPGVKFSSRDYGTQAPCFTGSLLLSPPLPL